MKKACFQKLFYFKFIRYQKAFMIMSLSTYLLLFSFALATAGVVHSQNAPVTMQLKDAKVADVLDAIEQQTEYLFFYNKKNVDLDRGVTVDAANQPVSEVLDEVFSDTDVDYAMVGNHIILSKKSGSAAQQRKVSGTITDEATGEPLIGVNVTIKGSNRGVITDVNGQFTIDVNGPEEIIQFSYIGYMPAEVPVGNQLQISVPLKAEVTALDEIVVVGYGVQKKGSVTGSISAIKTDDIVRTPVNSISGAIQGKVPGVIMRTVDGRPGGFSWIQIRNMGLPLFIIDGVQADEGAFNNLDPNDVENISVLKDASAGIYGLRASNGVVLITTKRGKKGEENSFNINTYYSVGTWSRFPKLADAKTYYYGRLEAQDNMNQMKGMPLGVYTGGFTTEELAKWQAGTEEGYQSYDWYNEWVQKNIPQKYIQASASGGSEKTNYYFSASTLDQQAVFKQYEFNRYNIQGNIESQISKRLKLGFRINGRIEKRDNPGVPGFDDYWYPRLALMSLLPVSKPYANNNPDYPAYQEFNPSNNDKNVALLSYKRSGFNHNQWTVAQPMFTGEYNTPLKGLVAKANFMYQTNNYKERIQEFRYNTYVYDKVNDKYIVKGGNQNPWYNNRNYQEESNQLQMQLNYDRTFAETHNISAMYAFERSETKNANLNIHALPSNDYIYMTQTSEFVEYLDNGETMNEFARMGHILRLNYNYNQKYLVELAGRYDGSWKFKPENRWGFFPQASLGYRISEEAFIKDNIGNTLSNLKLRGSIGQTGDDNLWYWNGSNKELRPFDWMSGYKFPAGTYVFGSDVVPGMANSVFPIQSLSWIKSTLTNIGFEYGLFKNTITGELDVFQRKRTGLPKMPAVSLIPVETKVAPAPENLESDLIKGIEGSLKFNSNIGDFTYSIGGNATFVRQYFWEPYNEKNELGNSWDVYRNSREKRYDNILWGHRVIGRFKSEQQIRDYTVIIDKEGTNRSLLPGDLIYADENNDGVINELDERPIGWADWKNPLFNCGLNLSASYKGLELSVDFAGGAMYTFKRNWELRNPYQNNGTSPQVMLEDRWHRAELGNPNSEWVPGEYPALRYEMRNALRVFDDGWNDDFWAVNVKYLRCRVIELGYNLPNNLLTKVNLKKMRVYVTGLNLFSFDNVSGFGIDAELADGNGLGYPVNRTFTLGTNITF